MTPEGSKKAIGLLEKAVAVDPGLARASGPTRQRPHVGGRARR